MSILFTEAASHPGVLAIGVVLLVVLVVFAVMYIMAGIRFRRIYSGSIWTIFTWPWHYWNSPVISGSTVDPASPGTPSGEISLEHGPYGTTTNKTSLSSSGLAAASPSSPAPPAFNNSATNKGYCSRTIYAKYAYNTQILLNGDAQNDPNGSQSDFVAMPSDRYTKLWDASTTTSGSPPTVSQQYAPVGAIIQDFKIPTQTDATIKANKGKMVFNLFVKYSYGDTAAERATNLDSQWRKVGWADASNCTTAPTPISENLITAASRTIPGYCQTSL